jgi:hypothetical protein
MDPVADIEVLFKSSFLRGDEFVGMLSTPIEY